MFSKIRLEIQGEASKVEDAVSKGAIHTIRQLGILELYKGASACLLSHFQRFISHRTCISSQMFSMKVTTANTYLLWRHWEQLPWRKLLPSLSISLKK